MDTRTLDRAVFAVGAAVLVVLIIFTIGMLGGTIAG
jgi:ABC-type antimicrobial peptide transport system permease subunit